MKAAGAVLLVTVAACYGATALPPAVTCETVLAESDSTWRPWKIQRPWLEHGYLYPFAEEVGDSMRFEIYKDTAGEYRWRLVATNGRKLADSGEGYQNLKDCRAGISKVKRTNATTPVQVEPGA